MREVLWEGRSFSTPVLFRDYSASVLLHVAIDAEEALAMLENWPSDDEADMLASSKENALDLQQDGDFSVKSSVDLDQDADDDHSSENHSSDEHFSGNGDEESSGGDVFVAGHGAAANQ